MSEIAILGPIITVWLRLPNLIILSFMDSEFVMSYDMFVLASGLSEAVSKYFQNAVLGYDNPSTKLYISRTSGSREFTSYALPKTSSVLFFPNNFLLHIYKEFTEPSSKNFKFIRYVNLKIAMSQ